MSLRRDSYPGYKANGSTIPQGVSEYSLINGQVSVGYKDNSLIDLSSINQGVGTARFELKDQNNKSKAVHVRLEDVIKEGQKDLGLNLKYIDSDLGTLNAYAYKDYSLMSSIKLLADFANDSNNSSHLLYGYISQISSILNWISGATSLASSLSKEKAKEVVLGNLANFKDLIYFDVDEYNEAISNYQNNPEVFNSVSDTIRLNVNLSSLIPEFNEPFALVLDFSSVNVEETNVCKIMIENLKIGQNYGSFEVAITKAYDDLGNFQIDRVKDDNFILGVTDIKNGSYVDLTDLKILMQVGINTTKARSYRMKGTFKYSTYTYDLDITICVLDEVGEDGLNDVIAHIYAKYEKTFTHIYSEIFVYYDTIYCKKLHEFYNWKTVKWESEFEYFKTTPEYFTKDIIYYIFIFILADQTTYDLVMNNMGAELPTKPLDFIKSFKNERNPNGVQNKHQFTLNVSGKVFASFKLTGNVHIEYDDNYQLIGLYCPLKVVIIDIKIDIDMQPYDKNYLENKAFYIHDFIQTFENPNKPTGNLGIRTSKDDLGNVYKVKLNGQGHKGQLDADKNY